MAAARRTPAAGQVEIEVDVAGLGFRDVLTYSACIPAIQVRSAPNARSDRDVGAGVTVAVGLEVIAFAPGSHDGYVLADARLVARRPAGLASTMR